MLADPQMMDRRRIGTAMEIDVVARTLVRRHHAVWLKASAWRLHSRLRLAREGFRPLQSLCGRLARSSSWKSTRTYTRCSALSDKLSISLSSTRDSSWA